MPSYRKVVQTTLTREEYDLLIDALSKRGMNIQEGLRKAALALVDSDFKINPNDPFFKIRAGSSGGMRDLSVNHDKYLYQREARKRSQRRSQ
ncbi:MAG: hypothetical protein ACRECH_08485 [Nitrososphaerales archaeon]